MFLTCALIASNRFTGHAATRGVGRGSASEVNFAQGSGVCAAAIGAPYSSARVPQRMAVAVRIGIRRSATGRRRHCRDEIAQAADLVEPRQRLPQPFDVSRRERAPGAVREFAMQLFLRKRIAGAAPERAFDPFRDRAAVVERDPQLGAERLAIALGGRREGRGVDAPHQRPRRGVAERLTLEILENDAAAEQGAREAVLHAEFRVEAGLRVGPVGMGEAARMCP